MGPDAAHEEDVGRIPPQGGLQPDGVATAEGAGWRLGLPPPPLEYAMAGAGLQEVDTYVSCRQNTFVHYI